MLEPNYKIKIDLNATAMLPYFKLIQFLNPNLTQINFEKNIALMAKHANYKVILVFLKQECIAICGYWIATKLYSGKYLELDNVIVHPEHQGKGIGKILSDACLKIAKQNQCKVMMLDAYIENLPGHKFYEREGFVKKGYHFLKKVV